MRTPVFPFICAFSVSHLCVIQIPDRSFSSLIKFIPEYILMFLMLMDHFLCFFFRQFIVLLYRNATVFCLCYILKLLNSLISTDKFLVDSSEFSVYKMRSSSIGESFIFSFPVQMPSVSFSCPVITLTGTSCTVLNKSDETGLPRLALDCSGKAFFSFTIEYDVTCTVDLSCMAFSMLRYIPSIPSLLRIFILKDVALDAFLHLLRQSYDFYLSFH